MEESKSAVRKEDSGSPGREVQLKGCMPGVGSQDAVLQGDEGEAWAGGGARRNNTKPMFGVPLELGKCGPPLALEKWQMSISAFFPEHPEKANKGSLAIISQSGDWDKY